MVKFKFLAGVFALFTAVISGAADNNNLLANGDFEKKTAGLYYSYNKGTWDAELFTEDGSWNKCFRMTLRKILTNASGSKTVNALLAFGYADKMYGIPVKPDRTYEFSFEVRGTIPQLGIKATLWNEDDPNFWKGGRSVIAATPSAVTLTSEWQRHQGVFRTSKDTRRAALTFNSWGDSKAQSFWGFAEGQFFMIDNVVVKEKTILSNALAIPNLVPAAGKTAEKTEPAFTLPAQFIIDQVYRKSAQKSCYPVDVKLSDSGDALVVKAVCHIPDGEKLRDDNRSDGPEIWENGDVLEFFFAHRQFAIGAGGGRYGDVTQWQGETARNAAGWTVTASFPYALLGDKTALDFNIARSSVKNQSVSLAPVQSGFNDRKFFYHLIFPEYREKLRREWSNIPETLRAERDRVLALPLPEFYAASVGLVAKIRQASLGNAKFLLGTRCSASDFSEPLEICPENLVDAGTTLQVRGAINESVPLVLTLTNRTARSENYQVTLHAKSPKNQFENLVSPPGEPQAVIRRGVLMKDDDSAAPTRRYDALPRLDQAGLVALAPGESALLWITFDMRGAKPGRYARQLRITPLSEPAKIDARGYHQGAMCDFPMEVEVLNIQLPLEPATPVWIMTRAATDAIFDFYTELGGRMIMVSPYIFNVKLDASGRRTSEFVDLPLVRHQLELFRERNIQDGVKFMVGYSAYEIFAKRNPTLRPLTPEWRNAWQEYIRLIDASFRKQGLNNRDWVIELFDEPLLENMERDLEAVKLARVAVPEAKLQVTWCVDQGATGKKRHRPEHIRKFAPYITEHCFWHGLLMREDFQKLVKELQQQGSRCGFYSCNISMRLPLYDYYRLHAWKAWQANAIAPVGMYCMLNCNWGKEGATSWKSAETGGIVYRYGDDCIPSIRSEVLRQGLTDMKYLRLLEKVPAAQEYLRTVPETMVRNSHNPAQAETFRTQAIKYLLDATVRQ